MRRSRRRISLTRAAARHTSATRCPIRWKNSPIGFWHLRYEREKPPPMTAEETAAHMARRRELLWSYVPLIKCPSLVVHGADSVPQSFESLERFRATLPNGSIVQIANASHDVQEDEPKAACGGDPGVSEAHRLSVKRTHLGRYRISSLGEPTMNDDAKLQLLLDRAAIEDCLVRYCHAIDRCDAELLRGVYWPDAVDDHIFWRGNAEAFVDFCMPVLKSRDQTLAQCVQLSDPHRRQRSACRVPFPCLRTPAPQGRHIERHHHVGPVSRPDGKTRWGVADRRSQGLARLVAHLERFGGLGAWTVRASPDRGRPARRCGSICGFVRR